MDLHIFQHLFGNCHGEMSTILGLSTLLGGGAAGFAVFRNRLAKLPLIGRFLKPKHDCCDHKPNEETEPEILLCRACEEMTTEVLCDCSDGGTSSAPYEEKCWVCKRHLYCTKCREERQAAQPETIQ